MNEEAMATSREGNEHLKKIVTVTSGSGADTALVIIRDIVMRVLMRLEKGMPSRLSPR